MSENFGGFIPKQSGTGPQANDPYFGEFAALVHVISSRFVKQEWPAESGYKSNIAVKWIMGTTKGKQFDKNYSTGLSFDDGPAAISADGKRLIAKSADFKGFGPNSDALYMLTKAISAGFPADKINDDISVFEGNTFFIATDKNPKSAGSSPKPYPKRYHPEGWTVASQAAIAKQAAKAAGNGPTTSPSTPVSSYTPPLVVVAPETLVAASQTLLEILAGAGGTISRNSIPAAVNNVAEGKGWTKKQRQDVTLALWDLPQLTTVVNSTPILKIENETVSYK